MNQNIFNIAIPISRAYQAEDGTLRIQGIASSTELDTYETIFNSNCQTGFELDINNGADTDEPVQLEAEHKGHEEPMNILGPILKAQVNEKNELMIEAMLDRNNPKAVYYYDLLTNPDPKLGRPKKLGLSISGYVVDAKWEYNEELRKQIRVFNRVRLEKVGIVREPANPSTWVSKLVRSHKWNKEDPNMKEATEREAEIQANLEVEEKESATRIDIWGALGVLDVMEHMLSGIQCLSSLVDCEKYEPQDLQSDTAAKVLESAKGLIPMLQSLLTEEVTEGDTMDNNVEMAMDSSNSMDLVKEDLSDDVTYTRSDDEAPEIESGEEKVCVSGTCHLPDPEEEIKESAEEVVVEEKAEDVIREVDSVDGKNAAENTNDNNQTPSFDPAELTRSILESLTSVLDEFKANVQEMINEKTSELQRSLGEAIEQNKELVNRLAKIENSPTSAPGMQLLNEEVVRKTEEELAEDAHRNALSKAKETGNAREMIKLMLLRNELSKFNVK